MEKDLADLKAICERIIERHRADDYNISETPVNGLLFEEVLGCILDDYIPASLHPEVA